MPTIVDIQHSRVISVVVFLNHSVALGSSHNIVTQTTIVWAQNVLSAEGSCFRFQCGVSLVLLGRVSCFDW